MNSLTITLQIIFLLQIFTETSSSSFECTNRFEYRHMLKSKVPQWGNCTYIVNHFPMCKPEVEVWYRHLPPYVDKQNESQVHGLIPEMLRQVYETCCMGCTKINFKNSDDVIDILFKPNLTLGMPFESALGSKKISGKHYVNFLQSHNTVFLAREMQNLSIELSKNLFLSVIKTWPLLLIAFLMAVIAGCIVWFLDMWFNKDEFPSHFPRGPFEGFWWAFVSMTTVGYGDRAPKSIVARFFAVIWILFGITIFSMYTASLTTALSKSVDDLIIPTMAGKKIGVLATTALGKSAAIMEGADIITFPTIERLIDALKHDDVEAIAMDEYLAEYMLTHFESRVSKIRKHHGLQIDGNSYGVVTDDAGMKEMLDSFFQTNEDNRETMIHEIMKENYMKFSKLQKNKIDSQNIHSADSPLFLITVVTLVLVGIATIVLGFFCKWFVKHHHQHVPDFIKSRMVYRKEMFNPDMEALNKVDLDNNSIETTTDSIEMGKLAKDVNDLKIQFDKLQKRR
ncbi:uncharacterized protein [Clytia hemisphaerica]|uniref:Potassium channel domain-containing protein n=1 Tax=Clytia hemisphaerica TaxID=252671 RepID=A0A7M5VAV1_9CNID